jgi:hypothetical protein
VLVAAVPTHLIELEVATKQMKSTFLSPLYFLFYFAVVALAGCQMAGRSGSNDSALAVNAFATTPLPTTAVMETEPFALSGITHFEPVTGQTHHQSDGNRVVHGQGTLPAIAPVDIPLDGTPTWVVGIPAGGGALWAVLLEDGRVQAFTLVKRVVSQVAITPAQLPVGMPPLLYLHEGRPHLLVTEDSSSLTHPVLLAQQQAMAYIDETGNLVIQQDGQSVILPADALPDARLLVDDQARLLFLSHPSGTRYTHGVLGDALEATAITLVETKPAPRIARTIAIPEPHVIEAIAPLWIDLDGDGTREIIVTLAALNEGAQIVVYAETGEELGRGPAIGQSFRWRHQIAFAPFASDGSAELAAVLTPHIGGVVEFYRWQDNRLTIVARQGGYTSHVLGSRNLDLAVAGDLDGDGQVELLLPDQARRQLGGIRRTPDGAEIAYMLPIGNQLATNLAAVTLADERLAVGVGRVDGLLRIWQL